jgi:hypothetical protein
LVRRGKDSSAFEINPMNSNIQRDFCTASATVSQNLMSALHSNLTSNFKISAVNSEVLNTEETARE